MSALTTFIFSHIDAQQSQNKKVKTMDVQLPKSAKELSKLLFEYQANLIRNGSPSALSGLGETIVKATEQDLEAPPMAKFLASLNDSGEGILSCLFYWNFRDLVQEYQRLHNISSVEWHTANWKGEKIRYPIISSQLLCMEQDIEICSRYKDKVVARFLDFCDRWNLPIFVEDEDGNLTPSEAGAVLKEAAKHQWAWLGHNSGFRPVYCGETRKVLFYQSEYAIRFASGDTEDPMREGAWFQGREELTVVC